MAEPLNRPAFDAYTKDEEIDKLYGPGAAAQYRKMLLEAQQAYVNQAATPVERTPAAPRQRGPKNEPRALPKNRAVGGVRRKDERREDFEARMNRAVPRGARSGAGGGLDEQLFIDEGMAPDEARLKAKILRSEGGEAYRDPKDGKIKTRGVDQRKDVLSSTGRAYDPIRERKELMQRGREAVAARKEAQAADNLLTKKREDAIRKPGYVGGFANKSGTGEIKTTTKDKFDKRPAATTNVNRTLTPEEFSKRNTDPDVLRNRGQVSVPLREEMDFMKNDQAAELAAYKDAQARKAITKPQSKGFASFFSRK